MNKDYAEFIAGKHLIVPPAGFPVAKDSLNTQLFDWQQEVTAWALARGRAALFEDCGLGIGSEAYCALKMKRMAIGIELKPEYFRQAVKNCQQIETETSRPSLLDFA